MKKEIKDKIKVYQLKGLNDDEIAKALDISIEDIPEADKDMKQNTIDLYSTLQRDLTKLTLKEMSKDNSDSSVILNAIRLQADLQEKKLSLENKYKETKMSKSYIYDRDKEIVEASKKLPLDKVAKQFNISILSIKHAIDRYELGLSEDLQTLSPSIISETIGLDKNTRLKILEDAYNKKLTRKEVRDLVTNIKNEQR